VKPFYWWHALVWGDTGSGKTYFANKALHAPWQKGRRMPSIFLNSRNIDYVEGTQWRADWSLAKGFAQDRHLDLRIPDDMTLHEALWRVWDSAEQLTDRAGVEDHGEPVAQVVVDEAPEANTETDRGDPLEYGTNQMRGHGVRVVVLCQYPPQISTKARNALKGEVVFYPGRHGKPYLRNQEARMGYPAEEIIQHTTETEYGSMAYDPGQDAWVPLDPV
jgi:hypothetical protein